MLYTFLTVFELAALPAKIQSTKFQLCIECLIRKSMPDFRDAIFKFVLLFETSQLHGSYLTGAMLPFVYLGKCTLNISILLFTIHVNLHYP